MMYYPDTLQEVRAYCPSLGVLLEDSSSVGIPLLGDFLG